MVIQRTASPDDEKKKKKAVDDHVAQQRQVAKLLGEARKLAVDPARGLQDPDNLYRNSVEMLDNHHFTMTVLTPTHDSGSRKPPDLAYFDRRMKYPVAKGVTIRPILM